MVLLSTVFFSAFGISNWKVLALIWALIPVINGIVFFTAPIYSLQEEGEKGLSLKELLSKGVFWVMILLMVCSGASEQAVSQWASTFAEQGLGVSKTIGDLAGPMAFAFMMGLSRLFYGKYGDRIDLDKFMSGSTVLCLVSYLCISFAPFPVLSLAGCAVCGFSVGILWRKLQQSGGGHQGRRHSHVRVPCPGGRPGLFLRTYAGRICLKPYGR